MAKSKHISGKNAKRRKDAQNKRNWIYGTHAVTAALANPARRNERLVLSAEAARSPQFYPYTGPDGNEQSPRLALRLEIMPGPEIGALLPPGAVHQGAALLAEPLEQVGLDTILEETAKQEHVALVVLDQATDPRNIGAVARTAAALGAACLIVTERGAPEITGALAKAASGALEQIPLVRVTNLVRSLGEIKKVVSGALAWTPRARIAWPRPISVAA